MGSRKPPAKSFARDVAVRKAPPPPRHQTETEKAAPAVAAVPAAVHGGPAPAWAASAAAPAFALDLPVQRKLTVGREDDEYEREADDVADSVVADRPAPELSRAKNPAASRPVQRAASEEDRDDEKPAEPSGAVQRATMDGGDQEKTESTSPEASGVVQRASAEGEEQQDEPDGGGGMDSGGSGVVRRWASGGGSASSGGSASARSAGGGASTASTASAGSIGSARSTASHRSTASAESDGSIDGGAESGSDADRSASSDQPTATSRLMGGASGPAGADSRSPAVSVDADSDGDGGGAATKGGPTARSMSEAAAAAVAERGPGAPLPPLMRTRLETHLNVDLSQVRVHTGPSAEQAAFALRARAFAHGSDIWLARGESPGDLRLMAHEVAHVVQQDGVVRRLSTSSPAAPAENAPAGTAEPTATGPALGPSVAPAETSPEGTEPVEASSATTSSARTPLSVAAPAEAPLDAEAEAEAATDEAAESPVAAESSDAEATAEAEAEAAAPADAPADAAAPAAADAAAPAAGAAPAETGAAEAGPADDPNVKAVAAKLAKAAKQETSHAPAAQKAAEAGAAAVSPANDRSSRAAAGQVDTMSQAQGAKPEPQTFLQLLRAKLDEIAPKNLKELDNFKKSGKAEKMKGALTQQVGAQKDAATADVAAATEAEPDPNSVEERKDVPLVPETPGAPPPAPGAARAVPPKQPEQAVSLEASREQVDAELESNDIDDEQLHKANDPRFSAVVTARDEVHAHADAAPQEYRAEEQAFRGQASARNAAAEKQTLAGMRGLRVESQSAVMSKQDAAKARDEADRKKVADDIEAMFEATRLKVEEKLASLDTDVNTMFDAGEKTARERMESHVEKRKDAYKDRRYSGVRGKLRWVRDKFKGLPKEVNVFYEEGRDLFLKEMDRTIVAIADRVETRLKEAKDEIVAGKEKIRVYVEGLPKSLQATGKQAQEAVQERFDDLEQGVEDKKDELASGIAQRYEAAKQKADERLNEMKQADRGLVDRFLDFVGEVIRILREFKNKLLAMLAEAASAIGDIIKDPIGFLGNLISAIKQGVAGFRDRIWEHLKAGFFGWLFGALASAGITMPEDFSVKGIFGLVLQVLGLGVDALRRRVGRVVGERNVALIEKVWGTVSGMIGGGLGGLWDEAKEFVGDIKETVAAEVQEWVVTRIIKAAILKLVSMFNPVGAIIQAISMIISTVQFFIERINQIMELVQAIVRSVSRIAKGDVAGAAEWIEKAMARAIPVMISFLAALLGLGGIAEKVRGIIQKLQKKVEKAIDKVIEKIVGGVKKLFGKAGPAAKADPRKAPDPKADTGGARDDGEVGKTVTFAAGVESHRLWVAPRGKRPVLMVASTPATLESRLNGWDTELKGDPTLLGDDHGTAVQKVAAARKLLGLATTQAAEAQVQMAEADAKPQDKAEQTQAVRADDKTEATEDDIATVLQWLFAKFGVEDGEARRLEILGRIGVEVPAEGARRWTAEIAPAWWTDFFAPVTYLDPPKPVFEREGLLAGAGEAGAAALRDSALHGRIYEGFFAPQKKQRTPAKALTGEFRSWVFTSTDRLAARAEFLTAMGRVVVDHAKAQVLAFVGANPGAAPLAEEVKSFKYEPLTRGAGRFSLIDAREKADPGEMFLEYKAIAATLDVAVPEPATPPETEGQLSKYRGALRDAILAKFGATLAELDEKVLSSGVISRKLNKFRGIIFEEWVGRKLAGVTRNPRPTFLAVGEDGTKLLQKDREADGSIAGTTLVETKAIESPRAPQDDEKLQMGDYNLILTRPIPWITVDAEGNELKKTFVHVRYVFNNAAVETLWKPVLDKQIPGKHSTVVPGGGAGTGNAAAGAGTGTATGTGTGAGTGTGPTTGK